MKAISVYDLGKRTREIVEYRFSHPKKTQKEIAHELGVNESRISAVLNSPRVLAVYPVLARKRVRAYLPKSVSALEQCIDQDANMVVKLKAAETVLKSEKVLDGPSIHVEGEIRIASVRELQENIQKAANLGLSDVIEGEIVDEKPASAVQPTIHPKQ